MMDHSGKNFPCPTPETAIYWEGCRKHELRIQHCSECGYYQFYPRIICTRCMSRQLEWVQAEGCGQVLSYTTITRPVSEAYADDVPYVVALIQLNEGPTMMSNVIHCDPEQIEIGMPVKVVFEDWSEEITIPKFCPIP